MIKLTISMLCESLLLNAEPRATKNSTTAMQTKYEFLAELSDAQMESWIIDTEPPLGRPTDTQAVKVEDAIETAANALTSLMFGIDRNNQHTYTPNCRYFLDNETAKTIPLGGIYDPTGQPTDPQAPPSHLAQLLEDILPHPAPLYVEYENNLEIWNYWHEQKRWEILRIYDLEWELWDSYHAPLYMLGRPSTNPPEAWLKPWWRSYNPRHPHPQPPSKQPLPLRTTGSGIIAALGAINVLENYLRKAANYITQTEDNEEYKDDLIARYLQTSQSTAAEERAKATRCKAEATQDIHNAALWIIEVTTPHSKANKEAGLWGMNSRGKSRYIEREHKTCTWEDADRLITQSIGLMLLHKWGNTIRSQDHTEANPIGRYKDGNPIPSPYEQGHTPEGTPTPYTQDIKSQEQYCNNCWYSLKVQAVNAMRTARETLAKFILPQ